MKALSLVVIVAVLLIVLALTIKRLKTEPPAGFENASEIEMPKTITELPAEIEEKVLGATEETGERTKKALENLD
jgi:hypothetical protein